MTPILSQFKINVDEVKKTQLFATSVSLPASSIIDTDSIKRSCIVLIVSAIDHLIHELVVAGMLEIFSGSRNPTPKYDSHTISLGFVRLLNATTPTFAFENEVRRNLGWQTFQRPEKIKDAISIISPVSLWQQVSASVSVSEANVKSQLNLLVDRRNMIAHEADIEPVYKTKRPISDNDIVSSIDFVEKIGNSIFHLVK